MVPIPTTHPDHCIDSISELPWLPHCEVEGIEAIPVLAPGHRQFEFPHSLVGFDKLENTTGDESALLHFFVADSRLSRLVRRPLHYIPRIAGYAAVTTPDFSLYRSMPPHRRVLSTALNRSFGVLFQSRGLEVIPTVRCSGPDDFEFAFAGIPIGSPIAVSNHGCWRSKEDKELFEAGLLAAVDRIAPQAVIIHGRAPRRWVIDELTLQQIPFRTYPSRIESIHLPEVRDGGR